MSFWEVCRVMKHELRMVYITTQNKEQAKAIGTLLVEKKLAACVNILDGMQSIYRWQGNIVEDNECILIAKTKASLIHKLSEEVCASHSYECPCVVSLPIMDNEGNAEYLQWLADETKG